MRKLKLTNLSQYVKVLSGLFVTEKNPHGITNKEIEIFCFMLDLALKTNKKGIDKEIKEAASKEFGCSLQIITNYVNKFKKKKLISEKNIFNTLFLYDTGIHITYEQSESM